MSIKNLLQLTATSVAIASIAAVALADEADYAQMTSYAGIYLEGSVGYVLRDWVQDASTPFGASNNANTFTGANATRGGFTGGFDLGYQFNENWALEGGWSYLPTASGNIGAANSRIGSGLAYGTLKGSLPIYDSTYVFGKLGAGYTYNDVTGNTFLSTDASRRVTTSDYWNPLFAFGVQYYFNSNVSVNFQYLYIPGYHSISTSNFFVPQADLFTVGVCYKFLV